MYLTDYPLSMLAFFLTQLLLIFTMRDAARHHDCRGDLFILDQHACDEKYRFETLQLSTTLHQQPLIAPLALECTWAEQEVIIGHMEVFERNGFKLRVEPLVAEGAHALSEVSLARLSFISFA